MIKNGHESNIVTVDKIMVLMEEITVLEYRINLGREFIPQPEDTTHLQTTVKVLKERVQELRDRVHD